MLRAASLSKIEPSIPYAFQKEVKSSSTIRIELFPEMRPADDIARELSSTKFPVDVYFWFEGTRGLPKSSILCYKPIFEILAENQQLKACLYSLRSWNFLKERGVTKMQTSTPLGETINKINRSVVEYIYSSSFFQYCARVPKEGALYRFINERLSGKQWLFALSENKPKQNISIAELFENKTSIFDCIDKLDVAQGYSPMQYMEAFYLIRKSILDGLSKGQKTINIVFMLPNDESKYYLDLDDIKTMLELQFGEVLNGIEIDVRFQFFKYGAIDERPYIGKKEASSSDISSCLNCYAKLIPPQAPQAATSLDSQQSIKPKKIIFIPRDELSDINGWNDPLLQKIRASQGGY